MTKTVWVSPTLTTKVSNYICIISNVVDLICSKTEKKTRQEYGNIMSNLFNLVPFHSGEIRNVLSSCPGTSTCIKKVQFISVQA